MIRTDRIENEEPIGAPPDDPGIGGLCLWEGWSADLATGQIHLGPLARQRYGIEIDPFGIMDLIRCCDAKDRRNILTLFEEASVISSSFCYSTTIGTRPGTTYPLFCTGHSRVAAGGTSGTISGLFVFPHFPVDLPVPARS
ncbi:hypothetical protein [Pararhizobium sp.]|uniref:hypothetical protein n=1 Tax=Pararhizobium sp. TaxID=1977563 RepID=UPI00271C1871|nr:hypothetical protein [Pararhizobium sp.]MDO9415617.1 hypothetical protein [Pararhizobium sp.]